MSVHHRLLGGGLIWIEGRTKPRRALEFRLKGGCDLGGMIDDLCDCDVARVQRNTVAEDQQQDERKHEGDGNAGRIANDLIDFFSHEAGQTHDLHDALLLACSCSSISEMNASSMLGLGRSGRRTFALISTGVPCASISPSDINTR